MGFFYASFPFSSLIAAGFLCLACLTDYIDGYLARTYHSVTKLGTFLDPIADKMLIAVVLLILANEDVIRGLSLIPAALILSREMMISGLREYLAPFHVSLPVSNISKWKTAFQMVALIALFVSQEVEFSMDIQSVCHLAGILMLWSSAVLALITGFQYVRASRHHLTQDAL